MPANIDQYLQNLRGAFSQLGQSTASRVPAQTTAASSMYAPQSYEEMLRQALPAGGWSSLFPAPKAAAPAPAAAAAPSPPPPPPPAQPAYDPRQEQQFWQYAGLATGGAVDYRRGRARGGLVSPTEAQKHAGNYKKHHISFHGLPISIETPKGATREGKDPNGKTWRCKMPADYGYIKRTEGADGDHVDVFVGPDRDSRMVFIINQKDHRTGHFNEHKAMIAYSSERAAVADYVKAFSDGKGHDRVGSVEPMSLEAFKHWLKRGKTKTPAKSKSIIEHALAVVRSKK